MYYENQGTAHQKVMVEELNQLEELDTYKELSLHIRQLSFEVWFLGCMGAIWWLIKMYSNACDDW